jgi:hypothetical protein
VYVCRAVLFQLARRLYGVRVVGADFLFLVFIFYGQNPKIESSPNAM